LFWAKTFELILVAYIGINLKEQRQRRAGKERATNLRAKLLLLDFAVRYGIKGKRKTIDQHKSSIASKRALRKTRSIKRSDFYRR